MREGYKKTDLGLLPVEWQTVQLSQTGQVVSGGTPDTKVPEYWDGDIAWCTPTDITALKGRKYISSTYRTISENGLKNSSSSLLPPGSLVICTRATIGDCAISSMPLSTNQGFKSIIPRPDVDVEFLYYLLNQINPTLKKLSSGSTFLELSKKAFDGIEVALPPCPNSKK